jgi:hypothetical protein
MVSRKRNAHYVGHESGHRYEYEAGLRIEAGRIHRLLREGARRYEISECVERSSNPTSEPEFEGKTLEGNKPY